jgi:hypothetical protein
MPDAHAQVFVYAAVPDGSFTGSLVGFETAALARVMTRMKTRTSSTSHDADTRRWRY